MQRQRSLRVHNNPWEYRNRLSQKRRRTVPSRLAMDSTELKNLKQNSAINKAICEEKVVISNIDNEIFIEMNNQQKQPESIEEESEEIIMANIKANNEQNITACADSVI